MNTLCFPIKMGIIGGGQLGRMLIQAGINWDIDMHILDPDAQAPCHSLTPYFEIGDLDNKRNIVSFGEKLDILTIEIERVNISGLKVLEQKGIPVFPQSRVIELIQNKQTQKAFYQKNHIPTPEVLENITNITSDEILKKKLFPCIWKSSYGGYDGRGVIKIRNLKDLSLIPNTPGFFEKYVSIQKEISIIVTRNQSGHISVFPPVELTYYPNKNLVDYLISPASLSREKEKEAIDLAIQLVKTFNIVGLLTVEIFIDKKNNLLVNEVAPRPHNSGHHTIEGNYISQYEQHLRAILDIPLGNTERKHFCAMVNLLGDKISEGVPIYKGIKAAFRIPGVYVYLYGKRKTKPYRKMGHITILAKNRSELIEKVKFIKKHVHVVSN